MSSARCRVCSHDSRPAIEQAILNGKPKAQVALTFGFTYTRRKDGRVMGDHKVIANHISHMGDAFRAAMEDREQGTGEAIATRMRALDAEVDKVIDRANRGDPVLVGDVPLLDDDGQQVMRYDSRLLLAAVREGRANAELLAKLAGKVEQEPEGLDALRRHLQDPKARRLLAQLDELAAERDRQDQET